MIVLQAPIRALRKLFWSEGQLRLRAGWRLILHLFLWLGIPFLLTNLASVLVSPVLSTWMPNSDTLVLRIVGFVLTLIGAFVGTWIATRYLDHRPFVDLGFYFDGRWWTDLCFGLILGGFLMCLIFLAEWMLGWIEIVGQFQVSSGGLPFWLEIVGPLVVFIVVGITEELLSRGYQLRNLAEGLNFRPIGPTGSLLIGWLLSSTFFGVLHVFNPNSSLISTANLILAGLFLGLGYILTRSLAIPIGLHITWNFFQGNVFGFPVSGNDFTSATVIAVEQGGPELWTGGAFGPEAGLIGVTAMLLGSILTLAWIYWRHGELRLQSELSIYRRPLGLGGTNSSEFGDTVEDGMYEQ